MTKKTYYYYLSCFIQGFLTTSVDPDQDPHRAFYALLSLYTQISKLTEYEDTYKHLKSRGTHNVVVNGTDGHIKLFIYKKKLDLPLHASYS